VEEKPLRFSQLQKFLVLNPAQIDRALSFLRKGLCIIPHTIPVGGKIVVEYCLSKRGAAFLESFKTFRIAAEERKVALGSSDVAELQNLYCQTA